MLWIIVGIAVFVWAAYESSKNDDDDDNTGTGYTSYRLRKYSFNI